MVNDAYIKLAPASEQQEITLQEVRELLTYYKEMTSKTGQQLSWHYESAAFPYEFAETPEGKGKWFYLKSIDPDNYRYIFFAVDTDEKDDDNSTNKQFYIQVTLSDDSTHGDKGKANEFCKFLAKKLKAELHLFNGRVMYYYKQKA
ncbi:MAG TPA: DUF1885 family protein [Bacillales bacterium]|nr:DUF1885 family protein [Bacillales bacterium]